MKSKLSTHLKSSRYFPVFFGIAIAIISQHVRGDEVIRLCEHKFTQEGRLPSHPISSFHINRPGYSIAYDAQHRNPSWVYEHLTSESLKGSVDRSNFIFKEDEAIPEHLRAALTDYRGSGYDRGHMVPAGDNHCSPEAMGDTFFLTNICPQCLAFNRGYWNKLEKHVRDLTKEYQNVYVITGPLYLPTIEENGKRYVKYEVIGLNDVAVPTHFFKVIILENWQGDKETKAYILPNEAIEDKTPVAIFETTVQKVEKAAGLIFTN